MSFLARLRANYGICFPEAVGSEKLLFKIQIGLKIQTLSEWSSSQSVVMLSKQVTPAFCSFALLVHGLLVRATSKTWKGLKGTELSVSPLLFD